MKSPFKKLRDFAVSKHSKTNDSSSFAPEEEPEDVTQGVQDVEDMRSQYEGLLTNAHIISGAAYDFSRSVEDMASYMMKTFGQFFDGEIGSVFSMLAKVQFEISKFLDLFATHVSQTIITPTEMMMSELQQVHVMKENYDEKRQRFNSSQKEMQKQKLRSGKTENTDQLVAAKDEYKEAAQILSFRLQSLKQGQSLCLITQAARYHSAQMHLFSKGLASITAMEPVMRQLALENNIDRSLSENDIVGTVSFDDVPGEEAASKNGAESESSASSPTALLDPDVPEMFDAAMVAKKINPSSKSAPISSANQYQREAPSCMQELPTMKLSMYALPLPSSNASRAVATQNTGHEAESMKRSSGDSNADHDAKRLLFLGRPTNKQSKSNGLPTELTTQQYKKDEGPVRYGELTNERVDVAKTPKMSRSFSHSGSITNRHLPASNQHQYLNNSTSISVHTEQIDPLYKSGPVNRSPTQGFIRPTSHIVSPTRVSPPQISELHKLPLPPSPKSASLVAHSAPLRKKAHDAPPPKSGPTSPLPPPLSGAVSRSLSIPAASSRLTESEEHKSTNDTQQGFPSPPLKPLVLLQAGDGTLSEDWVVMYQEAS